MKFDWPPIKKHEEIKPEIINSKDITPETFKKYFPLIINNPDSYKLYNSDLANVINISTNLSYTGNNNKEFGSEIKEYIDIIISCYKDNSFSGKVNILDFINTNAFLASLPEVKSHSFKNQIAPQIETWYKEESAPSGNYFLHTYLSSFFEKDLHVKEKNYSEMTYRLVSKNQYLQNDGNDLLISKPQDKQKIDLLFSKINNLIDNNKWDQREMLNKKGELFDCFEQLDLFF